MTRPRIPSSTSPAWVAAETLGAALAAMIGLLFIARLIGPQEAGTGAIAASVFLTIDFPLAALFGDALLQRRAPEERHRASALWATLLAAGLATLGLVALAPWIAEATGVAALTPMVWALAPLLPCSAAAGLLAAMALRARRYRLLALRVLLCQPLAIGAGVLAALAGWGAWAMVVQQTVATLAVFLLLAATARWRPAFTLRRDALAELWPVAGPQILALLVFNGRYRIFIIGLGMVVAEAVVAVTHIAFRLLDVAMAVVNGATSRLAMPRLAALQHDRTALAEAYGDLAQLQALIGLPIAVGLAITAPQLIALLMGGAWMAAAEPARLVALAAIPAFLVGPAPALWLALGRTRINLMLQLLAFTIPLLVLVVLQPRDPTGAALCWIGGSLAGPPVQLLLALRALNRPLRWLMGRLLAPLLGTLGMAAVASWVVVEAAPLGPSFTLLATAGCGAMVYLVTVALGLGLRWPPALKEA
jgi:O-antigen/teichoic acid export membrane protein